MDELLAQFLIEGRELVAAAHGHLDALAAAPDAAADVDGAFRAFHTLKGSVGLFDMAPAGRLLHAGEDVLEQARGGTHPLAPAQVAALVDTVDQVDRWIDAVADTGHLPADAAQVATMLVARLTPDAAAGDDAPEPATAAAADWLGPLLASTAPLVEGEARALVAFRYVPDPQCFFRGDDPIRIATAIPELVALRVLPHGDWPALEDHAPFECAIAVEGLSAAGQDAVRSALVAVGEEAVLVAVPARAREQEAAAGDRRTLRVDERRIDALADDVGELVLVGNALAQLSVEAGRSDAALATRLRQVQAAFDRNLAALHRNVTAVRMVPLAPTLRRLPRLVREIAAELDRAVAFTVEGERTEVDKAIADMLFEPLLHLIRNAIDHGVERAEIRRAAGKPEHGHVTLSVRRAGDTVEIALADDGAGLDAARIRAIAVDRGLLDAATAATLAEPALFQVVFAPGFSTARAVTAVSGRGVGMDAVKTAVEAAGGTVSIASVRGHGTTATLRLPLSAITTRLLLVRAGGDRYGVPFHTILETTTAPAGTIRPIGAGQAFVLRDRTVPVVDLGVLLGAAPAPSAHGRLLVVQTPDGRVAMAVDGFDAQIEALVRPPNRLLAGLPGIAGTTVLGDGQVLLVLDPARLVA